MVDVSTIRILYIGELKIGAGAACEIHCPGINVAHSWRSQDKAQTGKPKYKTQISHGVSLMLITELRQTGTCLR